MGQVTDRERSDSVRVARGFKLIAGRVTQATTNSLCVRLNNFSKSNGTSLLKLAKLSLSFQYEPPSVMTGVYCSVLYRLDVKSADSSVAYATVQWRALAFGVGHASIILDCKCHLLACLECVYVDLVILSE